MDASVALEDERFTMISVSKGNACGLRENGAAVCWGEGERDEESSPPASGRFTDIGAGYKHACGLLMSGAVTMLGRCECSFTERLWAGGSAVLPLALARF